MHRTKTSTLIISTYKKPLFLDWLLNAINNQSLKPDSIIITEDDEDKQTEAVVQFHKNGQLGDRIVHLTQPDQGFRKATAINRAVATTESEHLIFIDGDCIPHKCFVQQFSKWIQPGTVLFSRPVYIPDAVFPELEKQKKPWEITLRNLLRWRARSIEAGFYLPYKQPKRRDNRSLIGSGWACHRSDFVKVNGFDERFNEGSYGFEDTDIHQRLIRSGAQSLAMKNLAVYYHLGFAGIGESKTKLKMEKNLRLLEKNNAENLVFAPLGLDQWTCSSTHQG